MNRNFLIACLFTLLSSQAAWANTMWFVTVDTSAIAGQTGSLDFQFNPADLSAPSATATLSSFTSNGTLLPTVSATGAVTGNLGSTLVLGNSQFFNDWLQDFRFGSSLSFKLNIDVPVPNTSGAGTAFSLSLYDSAFNSLLADPVWGAALVVNANDNGSTEILAQSPEVRLTTAVTAVPEPQSLYLFLIGFGLIGLKYRKSGQTLSSPDGLA